MERRPAGSPEPAGRLAGCLPAALVGVLLVAAVLSVARRVGYPWNLMREQVSVRAQEAPPRPLPEGVVPFRGGAGPTFPTAGGAQLFEQQCAFCHGRDGRGGGPVAGYLAVAPADLTTWAVQGRTDADLARFLAAAPGPMPAFAHQLSERERARIVEYLRTLALRKPPPWKGIADPVMRGKVLYEALDCARCHGPDRPREGPGIPPDLDFAGSRYRPEWLAAYLEAPHPRRWKDEGVRPESWMPAFRLERGDARALAAFLATRVDEARFPPRPESPADPSVIALGADLFEEYQCLGCHRLNGEGADVGPDLTGVGRRLRPEYVARLLRDPQSVVPGTSMKNFDLWEEEVEALVRYLETLD